MLLATAVSVSDGIRVGASLHLHVHPRLHLHLYLLVPAGLVKEAAAQRTVYEDARDAIHKMSLTRAKAMSKDKLFSTANWDEAIAFVAPPTSLGKVEFKQTRVGSRFAPTLLIRTLSTPQSSSIHAFCFAPRFCLDLASCS